MAETPEAEGVQKQIKDLEEEIAKTKYNKHTQFHIGQLKAKLARLKDEHVKRSAKKEGSGYSVKKSGDATAILVGFPSVGKSTILNKLTNAESKVGAYDFTTLDVIPGMMQLNRALIQLLDVPGLIEGVSQGKGRGREILAVVRNADLVVFITDNRKQDQIRILKKELYDAGFRLDQSPPDVTIKRTSSGGLDIGSAVRLTKMSLEEAQSIFREFRYLNAEVVIRTDVTADQLIDCILGNRVYIPSLNVINKIDTMDSQTLEKLKAELGGNCITISADKEVNLDGLRQEIWRRIGLMRVYLKRIGKEPDMKDPLIMKKSSTAKDAAIKIHQAFGERYKFARVWGSSRFGGQKLGMDYKLKDEDIVEFHLH